jgi:pimeloyl-ACP methyl ester carboxylesterase
MLRLSGIALAGALALLAGWFGLACAMQRTLLFPAPPAGAGRALDEIPGAERVWIETPRARSEAWLLSPLPAAGARAPLVLFAHGNGELIDDWVGAFEPLRRWGAAVLLVEYPGYGRSTGSPSQASIAAAMAEAYDRARQRADVDPDRIVAYGRSLGGGAACALVRERRVAALVLESTFTSVRRLARGMLVPGFLVRDPFDNLAALRDYDGPVLIVHGEHDQLVPVAHARALHAAAPRSRLALERCGHNDCPRPWAQLRAFLLEHGLLEDAHG